MYTWIPGAKAPLGLARVAEECEAHGHMAVFSGLNL